MGDPIVVRGVSKQFRRQHPGRSWTLQEVLQPKGVAVVIEAAHQCMTTRGVHKPGVGLVTSRMVGAFRDDASTRREFLSVIGRTGAGSLPNT